MNREFNPSRLKAARIAKGLKQTEVAREFGFSRQFMHQCESGARTPNSDSISAFCELLNVNNEYFFKPSLIDLSLDDFNFRKQRTTTKSVAEQIKAKAMLLSEMVDWINRFVDLPPPNFPEISVRTDKDIELAAKISRQRWDLGESSPISNVVRVAERAGALVINTIGVNEKISALSVSARRPLILHNKVMNQPTRLRFNLAHELGHFVMHTGIQTGDHFTETEANNFAGAFLLPKKAFMQDFPSKNRIDWNTVFDLKKKWGVSAQAIIRRSFNLGIISASQYKSASIYISKNGWRKTEPHENWNLEEAELLESALKLIQNHFKLDIKDLCHDLGITEQFFSELTGIAPSPTSAGNGKVVSLGKHRNFRRIS